MRSFRVPIYSGLMIKVVNSLLLSATFKNHIQSIRSEMATHLIQCIVTELTLIF